LRLFFRIESVFKIFQLLIIVLKWSKGVIKDDKIMICDVFDLGSKLATALNVSTSFHRSDFEEFLNELSEENLISRRDFKL